jgi:hypothetical protein
VSHDHIEAYLRERQAAVTTAVGQAVSGAASDSDQARAGTGLAVLDGIPRVMSAPRCGKAVPLP